MTGKVKRDAIVDVRVDEDGVAKVSVRHIGFDPVEFEMSPGFIYGLYLESESRKSLPVMTVPPRQDRIMTTRVVSDPDGIQRMVPKVRRVTT